MRYVKLIKKHQNTISVAPKEHVKYLEILIEMNRSNAPQNLFNTVAKLIHTNFDKESASNRPPTRESLINWIEKKVHLPS